MSLFFRRPGRRAIDRPVTTGGYRLVFVLVCAFILGFLASPVALGQSGPPPTGGKTPALVQLGSAKDDLSRLTAEYKASLRRLAQVYREDLSRANEQLGRTRDLFGRGLVTQREVTAKESEIATLEAKIGDLERETTAADEQMAEMLTEADAIEQWARTPPPLAATGPGQVIVGSSFIRFTGLGSWTLAGAPSIKTFFQQRFGRPLPISAFGQSHLHDMWRWDHRNAMDVGLNPGSIEGQALIAYLKANGIPFGAFRQAIPGVATGPHIHVGMPSHRLAN